jgi:hypothetical protein
MKYRQYTVPMGTVLGKDENRVPMGTMALPEAVNITRS